MVAKPFEIAGVVVVWPEAIYEQLVQPGPCTGEDIVLLAEILEGKLKPAS